MQRYFRLLNVFAGAIVLGAMFLGGGGAVQAVHRPPSVPGRVSTPGTPAYKGYGKDNIPWNIITGLGDFDGDGITDFAVWTPSTGPGKPGEWQVCYSGKYHPEDEKWKDHCRYALRLGEQGDIPVPGDYVVGDNLTDYAVYRPALPGPSNKAIWYICENKGDPPNGDEKTAPACSPWPLQWGEQGDIPVPGNYDPEPASINTDIAVWQPSTGIWQIRYSRDKSPHTIRPWYQPQSGDIPVPGKYEVGSGKTDYAVYQPPTKDRATGIWQVCYDYDVQTNKCTTPHTLKLGQQGDVPVPFDYDGDNYTDFAVWTPSTGIWQVCYAIKYDEQNNTCYDKPHRVKLGEQGDIPVPGNYNGDHYAVYRPAALPRPDDNGVWYICKDDTCQENDPKPVVQEVQWGAASYIPV